MSRDTDENMYYESKGGQMPIRWTSPEALEHHKFSTASDCWAYGVLLYEIWTKAEMPYKGMTNQKVWVEVAAGYRLSCPSGCMSAVHGVMMQCWKANAHERPTFTYLRKFFEKGPDGCDVDTEDEEDGENGSGKNTKSMRVIGEDGNYEAPSKAGCDEYDEGQPHPYHDPTFARNEGSQYDEMSPSQPNGHYATADLRQGDGYNTATNNSKKTPRLTSASARARLEERKKSGRSTMHSIGADYAAAVSSTDDDTTYSQSQSIATISTIAEGEDHDGAQAMYDTGDNNNNNNSNGQSQYDLASTETGIASGGYSKTERKGKEQYNATKHQQQQTYQQQQQQQQQQQRKAVQSTKQQQAQDVYDMADQQANNYDFAQQQQQQVYDEGSETNQEVYGLAANMTRSISSSRHGDRATSPTSYGRASGTHSPSPLYKTVESASSLQSGSSAMSRRKSIIKASSGDEVYDAGDSNSDQPAVYDMGSNAQNNTSTTYNNSNSSNNHRTKKAAPSVPSYSNNNNNNNNNNSSSSKKTNTSAASAMYDTAGSSSAAKHGTVTMRSLKAAVGHGGVSRHRGDDSNEATYDLAQHRASQMYESDNEDGNDDAGEEEAHGEQQGYIHMEVTEH